MQLVSRTNKLKRTNSRTELLGNNFLQAETSHPGGRLRRLRGNHLTRPSELKLKIDDAGPQSYGGQWLCWGEACMSLLCSE